MNVRATFPDAVRGAALLGVGIVNLPFIAAPLTAQPPVFGAADALVAGAVALLLQAKIYLIFALLFGFGAAMAWRHADAPARHRRRAAGLLLFGLLHATLVFVGDILMLYALLSVLLRPLLAAPPHALRRAFALSLAGAALGFALLAAAAAALPPLPEMAPANGMTGGFADSVSQRLRDLAWVIPFSLLFNAPLALAAMIAGVAAARADLLARPDLLAARLRHHRVPLLLAAIAGNAAFAAFGQRTDAWAVAGLAGLLVGAPAGAAVWVMLAARALSGDGPMVRLLAAAGRMSLTIYLGQGIVANALFLGWGLGWFGMVGSAGLLALAVAIWLALALVSQVWLRWFVEGPDEWLLRCIVAGRWRPLARAPA